MTSRLVLVTTLSVSMLVFGALAWGGSRGNVAVALTNCSTGSAGLSSIEAEVIVLMNGARAQAGLGPLMASPALNQAAAWMAEDFNANAPSHTDSLGRSPAQRVRDCGYPAGAGENIAWGYGSASSAFAGWMSSPGHKANILGSYYQVVGVGYANGAWVANFGSVVDAGAFEVGAGAPPPPPPPPTATPTQPAASPGGGGSNPPFVTPPTSVPTSTATVQPSGPQSFNPGVGWQGPIIRRASVPMLAAE